MTNVRISVCIPTIRTATIGYAVRSVTQQTFKDWELVVVGQGDEASLCEETLRAADGDPRVRYIHLNRMGASAARNAGFAATTGEVVAFMDDDCEARADWLATLDQCFTPDIGLVCGTVEAPAKERRAFALCPWIHPEDAVFIPEQSGETPPLGFGLLGANMAVRRLEAIQVGIFDECLGAGTRFGGGEEHDLFARLARHGVHMRSTPRSVVRHTYGYRYGIRALYLHRRNRVRGDGALAGKCTLLRNKASDVCVRSSVRREAREQLRSVGLVRLPYNIFRLLHFLKSYRECLMGYELCDSAYTDPATAVLRPLPVGRPVSSAAINEASSSPGSTLPVL